jgi:4,5-dihydroxyphthalate decarboxylase
MRRYRMLGGIFLAAGMAGFAQAGDLALQVATQEHPHVRALFDGRVKVQGCTVQFSTKSLQALEQDMNGEKKWDVLEVDLLPFLQEQSADKWTDYTLIPVFLSRSFQLRNIFIRTDRGIQLPADLRGKTVGVSGYGSTTPTLIRGIFQSSWSVKPGEITWLDTQSPTAPKGSLTEWLESGKVDAIFSTVEPPGLSDPKSKVARLFPDYRAIEYNIFKETRVFAIVTALAVKKKLVKDNPWLPESLFIAFSQAKKKAMADLTLPLPWGGAKLEEMEHVMGKNFWSYGVKSNPKTLNATFRFAKDQGLFKKPLDIEDVFDPSTLLLLED